MNYFIDLDAEDQLLGTRYVTTEKCISAVQEARYEVLYVQLLWFLMATAVLGIITCFCNGRHIENIEKRMREMELIEYTKERYGVKDV